MSLLLVGRVAEKAPPKSWCSMFVVVVLKQSQSMKQYVFGMA